MLLSADILSLPLFLSEISFKLISDKNNGSALIYLVCINCAALVRPVRLDEEAKEWLRMLECEVRGNCC